MPRLFLTPVFSYRRLRILLLLLLPEWTVRRAVGQAVPPAEVKQVLVLYGERLDLPAIRDVELGIREGFSAPGSPTIEWYAEHFDFARFPSENHNAILARYLRERYAGRKLDLVLAVSSQTLTFALNYRAECFPGVPVVFAVRTNDVMDTSLLPPDVTGLALKSHLKESVELALALQPDAKEIVIMAGSGESGTLAHAGKVLDQFKGRISWRAVTDLPKEEFITRASQVPRGDILLLLSMVKDSRGRAMSTSDMSRRIAADSAAPVYGVGTGVMDTGAAGGALTDFRAAGRRAANIALRVLAGEKVPVDLDESRTLTPLTVDWRALHRWNLKESRLPSGSVVMFREPTLWEEHRSLIIGIAAVGLAQAATIAGLLLHRARRRRLEKSLQESERKINLAVQSANLGLWMRDVDSGEMWLTEKCRTLFGFGAEEPVSYGNFLGRIHPPDRTTKGNAVQRALDDRAYYDITYRVVLPDGRERWISATGQAEYAVTGKPARIFGVCADITARMEADREALELRQELAHASRVTMMGQLSAALAHELNQPLGAILRNAEAAELFLRMDPPDLAEVFPILSDIRKDDQRAGGVIDRMRALLKRRDLKVEPLEVESLLGEVIAFVRTDAAVRQVSIANDMENGLPPVQGDRVQVQQVLLNLILNAMDATSEQVEGGRLVTVRARRADAARVEFSVGDTGPGIPAEKMNKLFEPFFTTKAKGMGVGLPISRTIIQAHGGRLWAENADTGGAVFRFILPVAATKEGTA